jgi:hypothetical protein
MRLGRRVVTGWPSAEALIEPITNPGRIGQRAAFGQRRLVEQNVGSVAD